MTPERWAQIEGCRATSAAVDAAWATVPDEAWGRLTRGVGGRLAPLDDVLFSRWREVEVHHVDLGLGYRPRDWPEDYVAQELARQLAALPRRLPDPVSTRQLLAWLIGRADQPGTIELYPWG